MSDVRDIGNSACFRLEESEGSDALLADRAAAVVISRHAASIVVSTRRIAFMKGFMCASTYVLVHVGSALA